MSWCRCSEKFCINRKKGINKRINKENDGLNGTTSKLVHVQYVQRELLKKADKLNCGPFICSQIKCFVLQLISKNCAVCRCYSYFVYQLNVLGDISPFTILVSLATLHSRRPVQVLTQQLMLVTDFAKSCQCTSALCPVNVVDMFLGIEVPRTASVLQMWSYEGCIFS